MASDSAIFTSRDKAGKFSLTPPVGFTSVICLNVIMLQVTTIIKPENLDKRGTWYLK